MSEGKREPGLYWIKMNWDDKEWTIGQLEEEPNIYDGERWSRLGTDVDWNIPDVVGPRIDPLISS